MNDVKSVLIDNTIHEEMKKFSKRNGIKIKFMTEKAIKEFMDKWSKENV